LEYNGKWGGVYVELGVRYEFIGEYEGVYLYWVSWNGGGKMMQFSEEDLKRFEDEDDP